jgi:hypothetical protein
MIEQVDAVRTGLIAYRKKMSASVEEKSQKVGQSAEDIRKKAKMG